MPSDLTDEYHVILPKRVSEPLTRLAKGLGVRPEYLIMRTMESMMLSSIHRIISEEQLKAGQEPEKGKSNNDQEKK